MLCQAKTPAMPGDQIHWEEHAAAQNIIPVC